MTFRLPNIWKSGLKPGLQVQPNLPQNQSGSLSHRRLCGSWILELAHIKVQSKAIWPYGGSRALFQWKLRNQELKAYG